MTYRHGGSKGPNKNVRPKGVNPTVSFLGARYSTQLDSLLNKSVQETSHPLSADLWHTICQNLGNMIRIRFHGRGGHGTKSASRIVGTAAFLSGYQAQDSPLYGAERRGAAVVAFTRIDSAVIRERGVIEQPDLIVLADETLLDNPDAKVLAGQESASAIFINTQAAGALAERHGIVPPVVGLDLTTLTHEPEMAEVGYDIPLISSPSVLHVGNAVARQTGSWRVERPVINTDACTRCGLCFVRCPDGAVALDEEGFPVIDYDHCKGCMICQQICPLHAIASEKETEAW